MSESRDEARVFVSTLRPEPRDQQVAVAVVLVAAAFFVAAVPFAKTQLVKVGPFTPIYESALIISDRLTAALLIGPDHNQKHKGLQSFSSVAL